MDRLDQLFARSKREIEAHTIELGDTDTGRYFINEASHLAAAPRLWAQSQYRTDHVVRDILEAGDVVAHHDVSRETCPVSCRRSGPVMASPPAGPSQQSRTDLRES